MRNALSTSAAFAATLAIVGALAPAPAQSQQPAQQQQAPSPPKAYKPVAIKLPEPVKDPSFVSFRKQLEGIAEKKDRAGLAKLVARNFFWMPEDKNVADAKKSGIDNLAKAIGLEGGEAPGWDVLASYAGDPTADPFPDRQGVICAPGDPQFDDKAAEELATATQTDPGEWGYPIRNGLEVRAAAGSTGPVIEKLGLYLVRVYPDDSPAGAVQAEFIRIVTPTGKLGFVSVDDLLPLAEDRLCYVKEGNAWKIAGVIGGASQ